MQKKKKFIKLGLITGGLLLFALLLKNCGGPDGPDPTPLSKSISNTSGKVETLTQMDTKPYEYEVDNLVTILRSFREKQILAVNKAEGCREYVEVRNKEAQPQHIIDDCQAQLKELKRQNNNISKASAEAENLYSSTLQNWETAAKGTTDEEEKLIKELDELRTTLQAHELRAKEYQAKSERGGNSYRRFRILQKRCENTIAKINAELEWREAKVKAAQAARALVIGPDDRIDHTLPRMVEIDQIMQEIKDCRPVHEDVRLPDLKVAPPPPPWEPDMVLTATGDLGRELLEPLVEQWLKSKGARPEEGNYFRWMVREGNCELDVRVPEDLQGAQPGKLRIRICPSGSAEEAFAAVSPGGYADLMVTGQRPTAEQNAAWRNGRSLSELGRSHRARVCYDALILFRGDGLNLNNNTVRSQELEKMPKVFSVNDTARMEACLACNMNPTSGHDLEEQQVLSQRELSSQHQDKVIVGVWHKDAARSIAVQNVPTICYATGWASTEAYANIPAAYRPGVQGVQPTSESIASGRYAYSYSIFAYRSTGSTRACAHTAEDLLSYISNADNSAVSAIIQDKGFVPVELGIAEDAYTRKLTIDDLPLPVLLGRLGSLMESFGYDDESTWLYGVRVPIPFYYEVGSTNAQELLLDPDAEYYTSTKAFARIREQVSGKKAIVLVLGHADVRWGGKLNVTKNSWQENLKTSEDRAKIASMEKIKPQMAESHHLRHCYLGTSWARPACDISLDEPLENQEDEMGRCRRVEVYIIFPIQGSDITQ